MNFDLAITSQAVVTPLGVRPATIFISHGTIAAVEEGRVAIPAGLTHHDVGTHAVLPGLVDPHVHINEPGRTEWEGFATATTAAAAGGVTTLIDMPLNSNPVTTTVSALNAKRAAAEGKSHVDCGFHAGFIPTNIDELVPLANAGVRGIKAFLINSGIDEFPPVTESDLRKALPIIARTGLPFLVHAELGEPRPGPLARFWEDRTGYANYLATRPESWEYDAIVLMIRLAREFSCPTHIVHLAAASAVPLLAKARTEGVPITVETCPHYLSFATEEIPDGRTEFKCAPPIRTEENRELLWQALRDGVIDFITSDHSPSPSALKHLETGDFAHAWGGISSLGLTLSVVWTEAQHRGFDLTHIARWLAERPAALVGLGNQKGKIAKGYDADLVVFDPNARNTIRSEQLFFRHKLTPYLGREVCGRVEQTFLDGKLTFDRGTWCDKPCGRLL